MIDTKAVELTQAERARVATMQGRIASLTAELTAYQCGLSAMLATLAERMGHDGECRLGDGDRVLLLIGKGGADGMVVE